MEYWEKASNEIPILVAVVVIVFGFAALVIFTKVTMKLFLLGNFVILMHVLLLGIRQT